MLGEHESIEIPQASEYAKERRKWEAHHSRYGAPGRPYAYRAFPKMLYKVAHVSGKGLQVVDKFTVDTEEQERNMNSRGFYELAEAGKRAEQQQTEYGVLAAERNYEIAHGRISEKAAAEVRAAEQEHGSRHLPEVKETPIPTHRKRGRKPKNPEAA